MAGKMLDAKVSGAQSIEKALEQLSRRMRGAVLQNAMVVAAQPMLNAAIARAPRDSGNLKDNIDLVKGGARRHEARVGLGVYKEAFYGRIIEVGFHAGGSSTREVKHRFGIMGQTRRAVSLRGGRTYAEKTRFVPPNPFMRRSLFSEADITVKRYGDAAANLIRDALRRSRGAKGRR